MRTRPSNCLFSAFAAALVLMGACSPRSAFSPVDTLPDKDSNKARTNWVHPSATETKPRDAKIKIAQPILQKGPVEQIFFDFNSANLNPGVEAKLNSIVQRLKADGKLQAILVGHADWIGDEDYNLQLSNDRALSVKDFLSKHQVDTTRIEILAKGEFEALTDIPKGDPRMRKMRRVDIFLVPYE